MTDAPKPIIQIQNVSTRFGKVTAVDNVSLDIMAGEPELQESYGMTPDMTDDLAARLRASRRG